MQKENTTRKPNEKSEVDQLILGAGPAGMACAMELHKAGLSSTLIEKEAQVGGLAKTLIFKEGNLTFRTDIGPHRFFSKNRYLYDFIEDLLKEKWICVSRSTRQYIDGKYYDYPINASQAFKNIGPAGATAMATSYFKVVVQYRLLNKPIENFEDYIVANFGRKLGEFNMLNYTEKIWGIPSSEIHLDWAQQRIKGLSLRTALSDAFFEKKKDTGPKSLVDEFFYPQFGTGLIYETIAEQLQKGANSLLGETVPTKIYIDKNRISKVELAGKHGKLEVNPKRVISSIPITQFIKLIEPKPSDEVMRAAEQLKWRSQVYLFVTVDKKQLSRDNWIYFPGKDIPFGRISEMKNFSADMSPADKSSLLIEFFVNEGDEIWQMNASRLLDLSLRYLSPMGFFCA